MLQKNITDLINSQINKELESAYLYLSFANYFKERGLNGFAHWYVVQANEEVEHANKFMDYLHDNNDAVKLNDIRITECTVEEEMQVLSKALQHEKYITALIENIYKAAIESHDYRTKNFLEWFIAEQLEEEKNAQELVDLCYRFACESCSGLLLIDERLGKREK